MICKRMCRSSIFRPPQRAAYVSANLKFRWRLNSVCTCIRIVCNYLLWISICTNILKTHKLSFYIHYKTYSDVHVIHGVCDTYIGFVIYDIICIDVYMKIVTNKEEACITVIECHITIELSIIHIWSCQRKE